jgi:chromate reductase
MKTIVGISGSLRRGSVNTALLQAAAAAMPEGTRLDILSIADVPLYNEDVEAAAFPPAVTALKQAIVDADALLLATPEYNNGIPGVMKNALDWASRPHADKARVFRGKPVAIVGASLGQWGTVHAQQEWLPICHGLEMQLWSGARLLVPNASKVFDENGKLIDPKLAERLKAFMAGFVASLG